MRELKVKFTNLNFPSRNKFRKWLDLGIDCDLTCGKLKPYGVGAMVYYEERIPYTQETDAVVEVKDKFTPIPFIPFLYRKELSMEVVKDATSEKKFKVVVDPISEGFSILHPSDRFNPDFGKMTALQDLLESYGNNLSTDVKEFINNLITKYEQKIRPNYTIVVFKPTVKDTDGNPITVGFNYKEKFATEAALLEWMFEEEPMNYIVYKSLPGGKQKLEIVKDDGTGIYSVAQSE